MEPEHLEQLMAPLPGWKKARIARFRHEADLYRTLLADRLARKFARDRYGVELADVEFDHNQFGKPRYVRIPAHFNLSHSGEWAAAAFDTQPIGIDIERLREEHLDAIETILSEEERSELDRLSGREKLHRAHALWTLKESFAKALGTGLASPIRDWSFAFDQGGEARLQHPKEAASFAFKLYEPAEGYVCSVCASGAGRFPPQPQRVWHDYAELLCFDPRSVRGATPCI